MCCALFRTTKLPVLNYLLLMFSYDMDSVIWLWPAPFLRKLYIARKLCLVVHLQRIWPEEPSTALWWCINEYLTSADTQSPITPGALAFGPSSRERARVPTMDGGGSPNSNHLRQKRWWFPRRYTFGSPMLLMRLEDATPGLLVTQFKEASRIDAQQTIVSVTGKKNIQQCNFRSSSSLPLSFHSFKDHASDCFASERRLPSVIDIFQRLLVTPWIGAFWT